MGFVRLFGIPYFRGVRELLQDAGVPRIGTPLVKPTSSILVRAAELQSQIISFQSSVQADIQERIVPSYIDPTRVNIIGHSMGGLDARYLISKLGGSSIVASLTTLATPHHGSPYSLAVTTHAEFLRLNLAFKQLKVPTEAFYELSVERSEEFNANTPDHPDVKYYSYSAAAKIPFYSPYHLSYRIIKAIEGDNDGLVSVKSATWGNHIRTLHADHTQLINWPIGLTRTSFDYMYLYREITSFLAKEGL